MSNIFGSLFEAFNSALGVVNHVFTALLFFDVWPGEGSFPFIVAWLIVGALYFTLTMRFINIKGFSHAIRVTLGHYDNPKDMGEVSHFQALTTALSGTLGLGNIAGVAIAISLGGPGATFWMIVAGLIGMSSKFVECTLAQMYREVRKDGHILGGPMEYLSRGFAEKKWPKLGRGLAVAFSLLCIGGSIGGGNSFQVNQSLYAVQETIPFFKNYPWVFGLTMAIAVGLVIIGGIKRIAHTAEKVVPFMCAVYILASTWIIFSHADQIPMAFGKIFGEAFHPAAAFGGFVGVMVMGFRRAAFSNEAGMGSASIAHSAAKTKYPVREGIVALLEPFIDTVVVCTFTAIVIVITGAYANPEYKSLIDAGQGAALTSRAFGEKVTWFPYVLSFAVILFAYATMISWFYYGDRCWVYLFGEKSSIYFRWVFLIFSFSGAVTSASNVLEFSDLMILAMGLPNIVGMIVLGPKVKKALDDYWKKLESGEMKPYRK